MLRKDIILLYDMHPSQCVSIVQDELCCMCCKVLNHPLYNPVLPLCDFCVPGPLKKVLKAMYLGQTKDIQATVLQWFQQQPRQFTALGIHQLVFSGMLP